MYVAILLVEDSEGGASAIALSEQTEQIYQLGTSESDLCGPIPDGPPPHRDDERGSVATQS